MTRCDFMGLMPERMSRVRIISHKKYVNQIIDYLHSLKALHIKDYNVDEIEGFGLGDPKENSEEISGLLVDIDSILNIFTTKEEPQTRKNMNYNLKSIKSEIQKIKSEINQLQEKDKILSEKEKELTKIIDMLEFLELLKIKDIKQVHEYATIDYIAGKTEERINLTELLSKTKANKLIIEKEAKKENKKSFIIFFDKRHEQEINNVLSKINFEKVDFEELKVLNIRGVSEEQHNEKTRLKYYKETLEKQTSVNRLLSVLTKELSEIKEERLKIKKIIDDLGSNNIFRLQEYKAYLQKELEKSEAPLRFAASEYTTIIEGWIPSKKSKTLKDKIKEITNDTAIIELKEEQKEAPILLEHSRPLKPYEFLLRMYSLPSYKELDPIFVMAFTFPIIFGMILGDIGYGAVLFLLFWALKKKIPEGKELFNILMASSVSTMVFGFLFGEIFGLEEIFGYELHGVLHRIHDINELLILTVIVGLIHVNIGLILGFINEYRNHGFIAALFEKISWMLLQIGGILLLTNSLGMTNVYSPLLYTIIVISIIWIAIGEGFKGIIELPGILSNIVSYTRIGAVGIASAILALLVNEFASYLMNMSLWFIPLVILVLILGHGINLLLGVIEPFIHTLRLHYVEHFTKYYHGGGIEFKAFGK